MSNHFSYIDNAMISGQILIWNSLFLANCPDLCHGKSWAIHTGTTRTIYLLPSLIVSYINQFDLSSCLRHPNWTSVLWEFSFNLYALVSVQPFSLMWRDSSSGVLVVLCCYPWLWCFPLGVVAWLPCTSVFLRWVSYAVSLIKPQEIVWSDLHTSVSPAYCG